MAVLEQNQPSLHELNQQLFIFAKDGNTSLVKQCLDQGANVNSEEGKALRVAAGNNQTETLKFLLDNGAYVHAKEGGALRDAVKQGYTEVLQILVKYGADLKLVKSYGLERAIQSNHIELAKLLLEHGTNDHTVTGRALSNAAERGHTEIVQLLLDHGANVHADNDRALRYSAMCGHIATVKLLLDYGADIDAKNGQALKSAALHRRTESVKFLIGQGADVHADSGGALNCAANSGCIESVQLLIEMGVGSTEQRGKSLRSAAKEGHYDVVELLLKHGAEVQLNDNQALCDAAEQGHSEIVRLLCQNGADVYARSNEALRTAMFSNRIETVRLLLEHGADTQVIERYREDRNLTISFAKLAGKIITQSNDKSALKYLLDQYDVEYPNRLKSDAFTVPTDGHLSFFCKTLLIAAQVASEIAAYPSQADKIFGKLVSEDIRRVENTSGLSWKKYSELLDLRLRNISNLRDIRTEMSECLTLPIRALQESSPNDDINRSAEALAADFLADGKSTLDFASLNTRWHKANNRVPIELRPYKRLGEWYPLFEDVQFEDGLSVHCLCTPDALDEEGNALQHCVGRGGFTSACQSGSQHIVSIRKDGVPLATIELIDRGESIRSNIGAVRQFYGYKNGPPPKEARRAWTSFMKLRRNGEIRLSSKRGLTEESKALNKIDKLEAIAGYPLSDAKEVIPQILNHYRERIFVSRGNGKQSPIPLISPEGEAAILAELESANKKSGLHIGARFQSFLRFLGFGGLRRAPQT